ncbi:A-kinase anchor protein 12 isoform X1 [Physeter macrocephalus]|uniref:A-kinase anchor protein 12 isoform X1 n=1 Tax=Physeter macrocephalus TaxID=9755 RepID=A0A2Y9SIN6_PHYMC|nr:A-kinase anchor protein 12 isoform X1 [Physeter catodon]|eukprot:XP_023978308.1 A-kinase anchor protein 12 isoform X1 [Physeter catodon]
MGAGSSTEQRSPEQPEAGSATPAEPEPEPSGGGSAAEAAPGSSADATIAAADPATKLLQKNGQLSTVNGLAEQGELGLQEGALNGQEEEVTVTDVGQRESEDVSERDSDKDMAANSAAVQDITKEGQEEMPEMMEQIPASESSVDELTQPAEPQANDVGFKKVFKFVGFKFTVKKDKTEKSDAVQLLTVKRDEGLGPGGSDGAGDHREPSREMGDTTPKDAELKQSTEKPEETPRHEQSHPEISLQVESGPPAEEGKDEGEEKQEKEPAKSPDSPTSPVASETASPFKKFFTQGWAGWRKRTSFRKPREDELEASEKKKEQEPEKADAEENEKTEDLSEQPPSQEARESAQDARLSAEYEKVELPAEDQVQAPPEEKPAPLATEVFDEKVEIVAEVHVSTVEKDTAEQKAEVEEAVEPSPPEQLLETDADLQDAERPEALLKMEEEAGAPSGDHAQPAEGADAKAPPTPPEGVAGEVEVPSSQERTKVQGSPLKKLFTSSGLKKLSGKKQKGKRGGDEESGEQHPASADSPDIPDEPKGESSASSPEEPEEITCLEKGVAEAPQDGETEEGTTSDGEKKREGVTPWASFKKMVTPKKRVRRLSESDKEDEVDKVKSSTLSSTESAASEMQEEGKGNGEEQKPEEPKRKVDTSVSWEALICVGSSKKRARKASSSDDEGGPKPLGGDSPKPEEAGRDREPGPDALPAGSQDHDQPPGSSSPEQAGSPSEGEGVSTWESFKRLVTSRKKSKSKLEEKSEDLVAGSGLEYSASDAELGKEESWVSIRKFIPGRRKKRLDGKQEQAAMEDTGPTEVNEDDSDVPAVVPLSEYDAVEREKTEAQQALKSGEGPEQKVAVDVSEELSKSLVHTVTVAVMDGTRAVTSIEERAPSWISASVTEPLEQAEDEDKPPSGEVFEKEVIAEETPIDTKTLPESQEAADDTVASKVELTPEALTAAETTEAFCAEEATEASGAEETTDMVSAVSQLTDFPDTTEEATPVQEVEGSVPDMEDQAKRTQEVLQAVAEKVKEESQLPDARGLDDTIQTTQKGQAKILEQVEEAEEDSHTLDQKEAMDGASKGHVQETKTETLTQGAVIVQATPESLEKVPPGTESAEARELTSTCPAETVAAVKPETVPEQAVAPDSAETLTDSETDGSTPVADLEATNVSQQTKIMEIDEDGEVPSGTQYQVTEGEALPELKEMPPEPSSFQSQEEKHSEMEEVLEHTDKEVTVETVPILSKTEVIQEAGRCADEEAKEEPSVEGLVSADTEITEKKVTEVALEDEVTKKAEFQKNDDLELQRPATSLPTPVERERVVQVERDKTELEPTQVNEEKLECKPAVTTCEELGEQLVQAVNVTVIDGEKEVISFEGSSSLPVHKEEACTEIQVQSSEASLALTAAAVGEKVLGEAIKILETAETLQSAEARLVPEEKSSEKDEGSPAQRGEDAVPTGTESQATSVPVIVSVTPEKGISADLEGDKTTSQKWESDGDGEQVGCQEGSVSKTREEDLKAEDEILKLETESCKLVQNVIQTVVDQLGSTEETAAAFQTQAQLTEADSQEAGQKIEKEEGRLQPCTLDETQTIEAKEESPLSAGEHTHPDVSKDANEALEKMAAARVESSRVDDQQLEEVAFPSKEKREGPETKSVPEDDGGAGFGERTEKSPFESREDEKGDAADDPGNQTSAPEDAEASGASTKEPPDAIGPKLKEKGDGQEVEFQEEKVQSESEKESKTQTQEETQDQEGEPARPEPTES